MNGSRMMSREALADFSIIALLAGVIVYVAASLFGTKERLNISVALHPSTPGAADCMIDVDDSKPLKAKRTHQVSWSISNTCTDAYVVKADTFQPRLQAGGLGPAEGILEKPAESKPIDKTG